jgi:CRISPR-associated protein Csx3
MKFHINLTKGDVDVMEVGFGDPATNVEMVAEVSETLSDLRLGGAGLHITGPCSLPVGSVIVHAVAHRYGYVAIFDPKLAGFVVAISHDPARKVGELIPA